MVGLFGLPVLAKAANEDPNCRAKTFPCGVLPVMGVVGLAKAGLRSVPCTAPQWAPTPLAGQSQRYIYAAAAPCTALRSAWAMALRRTARSVTIMARNR